MGKSKYTPSTLERVENLQLLLVHLLQECRKTRRSLVAAERPTARKGTPEEEAEYQKLKAERRSRLKLKIA